MNVSFNILKNLKKNLIKNKNLLLAIPTFVGLKYYLSKKNIAYCYAENTNEPDTNDFNDIYSDFNEDDLAGMGVPQEGVSHEEMQMIKQEAQKAQVTPPFSFARIPQLFMNPNDDKWNGLRCTLDWKPTKMYSLEYSLSASSLKKLDNFRLSCLNIVPNKNDPQLANVFLGRTEDDKNLFVRQQYMLSNKDRIEINSQWGKKDVHSGINVFEYNRKFDRLDMTLKLSPMENSFSVLSTAYKNFFVGMDAIQIQGMQFAYKYGFYYKFNKNLSCGATFNDKFSDISLHGQVFVNRNWTMLFNYMKSDNPYMKQMGMDLDINMANSIKYGKNTNIGIDINHMGKIHGLYTYKLSKFIELQGSFELGPLYKAKFNKDLFKGLGFGVKFSLDRFEELMTMDSEQVEEDLSEYQIQS